MSRNATTSPVDMFLEAVTTATIGSCAAWSDAAELDATVPNWRFSRHGARSVREEYCRWFANPGRLDGLRRFPIGGGEVIEYTLSWEEDGVPHAAHHVHILEVADGGIVRDTVMCGGRWPASLLAEMEETARA